MTKEMEFFIYLLEQYAEYKNAKSGDIMRQWDEKKLTDFIFNQYELYHSESIENAFKDIDSLLRKVEGKKPKENDNLN